MTHTLSPAQAGQLATRARLLRRQGLLTQHQYGLLDCMLWQARKPGSGLLAASLAVLARLAGQARSTATEGIRRLEELGLLQRIRRRVRVAWTGLRTASRVIANGYRLLAPATETGARSGREQPSIISMVETPIAAVKAAQEVLAETRRAMEARLLMKGT